MEDVARAFEIILFKGKVGVVYNIGGSNERANIDVAKDLIKLAGYSDGIIMLLYKCYEFLCPFTYAIHLVDMCFT